MRFLPWRVGAKPAELAKDEPEGEPAAVEVTMSVDARLARSVVATVGAGSVEAWEPSGAVRLKMAVPEHRRLRRLGRRSGRHSRGARPACICGRQSCERLEELRRARGRAKSGCRRQVPSSAKQCPPSRAPPAIVRASVRRVCGDEVPEPRELAAPTTADGGRPAEPAACHSRVPGEGGGGPARPSWPRVSP